MAQLSYIGNEKNEAVKELIEEAIKVCKNNNKYIGICGQGPSGLSGLCPIFS